MLMSTGVVAVRRYHNEHFKPPSMDELPVPRGSWQAHHDAQQRRYNLALLFGVAFTAGTLVIVRITNILPAILCTNSL